VIALQSVASRLCPEEIQSRPFPMRETGFCVPRGCRKVRRVAAGGNGAGGAPSPLSKERRSGARVAPRGGMAVAGFGAKSAFWRRPAQGDARRASAASGGRDVTAAARVQVRSGSGSRGLGAVDKPRPFDSFDSAKMAAIPGGSAFSYRRGRANSGKLRGVTRSCSMGASVLSSSAVLRGIHPAGSFPRYGAPGRCFVASNTGRFEVRVCGSGVRGTGLASVGAAAFVAPAVGAGRLGRDGHERVRFWGWKAGLRPRRDAKDHSCRWAGFRRERVGA
jgi:hypothetical protein